MHLSVILTKMLENLWCSLHLRGMHSYEWNAGHCLLRHKSHAECKKPIHSPASYSGTGFLSLCSWRPPCQQLVGYTREQLETSCHCLSSQMVYREDPTQEERRKTPDTSFIPWGFVGWLQLVQRDNYSLAPKGHKTITYNCTGQQQKMQGRCTCEHGVRTDTWQQPHVAVRK